jgi:predicted ABC-class ATPase
MRSFDELERRLREIDGRGYGAYKSIRGEWVDGPITVSIDHVQSDPFATPSRVRVRLQEHSIPEELWGTRRRRIALTDYLLRQLARSVKDMPRVAGSGKSGSVMVDAGDAEVLPRSGCGIDARALELRIRVGLPAKGRSVLGRAAASLLTGHLPDAVEALHYDDLDHDELRSFVDLVEDHGVLQDELKERGYVAFVREGSILPRRSGVSSRPMDGAVPFESPESLRATLPTRHHGEVTGMAVPEGVTLITGGGFHGKTTLLEAIQVGVYPHVPGDGREWVVTRPDAVKVRSEDGRSVAGVDLRPFIRDLPQQRDTASFTTEDASGSTSLAATVLEAIEAGTSCLLLDEDTCATNLLVRDARMQALIARETIVPFLDRVRELYDRHRVSTLLVLGGSGDYLDVAERVLLLEDYAAIEATDRAKAVARDLPTRRSLGETSHPLDVTPRKPRPQSFDARRGRKEKVKSRGLRELLFGEQTLDLSALDQLVDDSQARALGVLLTRLGKVAGKATSLRDAVEQVHEEALDKGLFAFGDHPDLALPRPAEIAAAVNRLRSLRVDRTQE